MRESFYLAWQYLKYNRITAAVLVAAVTLIIFLPAALQIIVRHAEQHFRLRAVSTPLLVGPRGSELELVLASVYFDKPLDQAMRWDQLSRVHKKELGSVIPLHTRFTVRDSQVVGTTEEYLDIRKLQLSDGRRWSILGECVIGSNVANRMGLQIGDKVPVSSSPAFVLDSPPLRLYVAGVLAAAETPDDEVILVDVETAWILEGLGHGHATSAKHGSQEGELYTDITEENAASFHFHGSRESFPISSILIFPNSDKAQTLLLGQYLSPEETVQIVKPSKVMESLLRRVLMVRSYIVAAIALMSIVTLLTMTLVMVLSIRLRHAELATMTKIGCSSSKIASLLAMEVALILVASVAISGLLVTVTTAYGPELVRLFVL